MNMAEIDLCQFAAAKIDDHQPAAMRQKFDFLRQIVAADDVDHHIDAAPVGGSAADLGKIGILVIDRVMRAEGSHRSAFLVISGGGEHGRAMRPRDLDGGAANAAGAALYQDRLAGLQGAPVHHVGPDSAIDLWQAGGVGKRHPVRNRHALSLWCQRIFGIAATDQKRADPVADGKAGTAAAG